MLQYPIWNKNAVKVRKMTPLLRAKQVRNRASAIDDKRSPANHPTFSTMAKERSLSRILIFYYVLYYAFTFYVFFFLGFHGQSFSCSSMGG